MKTRILVATVVAAVAFGAAGCSSKENNTDTPRPTTVSSSAAESNPNKRGAVEVALGSPVTLTDADGNIVLAITDTRLDTSTCTSFTTAPNEAVPVLFTGTVEIGTRTSPEWLWSSDFYYVDGNGKVAQNRDVVDRGEPGETYCTGTKQWIDLPPNSSMDGAVGLVVPKVATAIGYHTSLLGDDLDKRIEWKLPAGWANTAVPGR